MSEAKDNDDAVLQSLQQHLDEAEQSLSAEVLSQLRQRREIALQQGTRPRSYLAAAWSWLSGGSASGGVSIPRTGLAVAFMTAFVLTIGLTVMQPVTLNEADPLMDLPILSATEEFELYEELEFYQWLEFEGHTG